MHKGRFPKFDNEIAIAAKYAKEKGFAIGNEIEITANGKTEKYLISGFTQITNIQTVILCLTPESVVLSASAKFKGALVFSSGTRFFLKLWSYTLFPAINTMMIAQTGIPYAIHFLPLPVIISLITVARHLRVRETLRNDCL